MQLQTEAQAPFHFSFFSSSASRTSLHRKLDTMILFTKTETRSNKKTERRLCGQMVHTVSPGLMEIKHTHTRVHTCITFTAKNKMHPLNYDHRSSFFLNQNHSLTDDLRSNCDFYFCLFRSPSLNSTAKHVKKSSLQTVLLKVFLTATPMTGTDKIKKKNTLVVFLLLPLSRLMFLWLQMV